MLSCNRVTIMLSYSRSHTCYNRSKKPQECNMVIIAKATDSEPASVVCDMNSPSSKWLTTLRVNFSKEVRRPCSVSAGCCFGRGGSRVSVWVRYGCWRGSVVMLLVRKKGGQALQKWGPRTMQEEVAFWGNGVGSVTNQQKEQCPNGKGQKG